MKSITVDLPESLHHQLAAFAHLARMPLEDYIVELLMQRHRFDTLRSSLRKGTPEEIQRALNARDPVLPEPELTPELVEELQSRIAAARRVSEQEQKHLEGYLRHPVQPGEFDVWIDEQHNDPL